MNDGWKQTLLAAALIAASAAAPLAAARAEPPLTVQAQPRRSAFSASAAYRLLAVRQSDIVLDEDGTPLELNQWAEQRIRLMSTLRWRRQQLSIDLGADLFSGVLAGDTTDVGARFLRRPRDERDAYKRFEPRRAMLRWRTRYGELRAGHQVSNWGYGILANSGEQELAFGDPRFGDLVERLAFVTSPAKDLFLALAFDLVYRDANAELVDGDIGLNSAASVFLSRKRTFFGLYGAFREQWDADGDGRVEVLAADLHARHGGKLLDGKVSWDAGVEALLLLGSTSRFRPEPALDRASVLATGGVLRGQVKLLPWRLSLTIEVGLAGGDNDRNDDVLRQMTFHPDYRVGLIMFNELLAGLTARSADRIADPTRGGGVPYGAASVPSGGGVHNALYLWPRLCFEPLTNLKLRFGVLHARALADMADPFSTNHSGGGSNRNYFGGSGDVGDLGLELQLGARYRFDLRAGMALQLGVDWGHLFAGAAYVDALGQRHQQDIDHVAGRVVLQWRVE